MPRRRAVVIGVLLLSAAGCADSDPVLHGEDGGPNAVNATTPDGGDPSNGDVPVDPRPDAPPDGPRFYDPGPGWTAKNAGGFDPVPANLPQSEETFDVVIFGAGTGGSAAAIQAARMGASVAVVEETDWVGGQMTAGGVSTMDEGPLSNDCGLYAEFIERAEAHYAANGKRARRCGIRPIPCTEPHVGQQILRDMLSEAGVTLFERARPVARRVDNDAVTGLHAHQTSEQRILVFEADVFIDATEYGDLLAVVGAAYRVGNSNTDDGVDGSSCVQDVTVAPIIRRYDSVPQELQFSAEPPGYGPDVESKFSDVVTVDGKDWETLGWGGGYPVNWTTHVSYRATPDSTSAGDSTIGDYSTITKTGVNWANDFPYTVDDIETRRFDANCEAKLHTLQFMYYAQNVMGVDDWALADDEGYDSAYNVDENDCPQIPAELDSLERHLNPIPYVRESRRMIGEYTVVADDIQRAFGKTPRAFDSAIAVGDYAMDLHACNGPGTYEQGLESAADHPDTWAAGPFQIPLEALVARDLDGLIAAEKNISQSRLVNGATRLQPSTMHTGQAAGALAAVAVERGIEPRDVPAPLVQAALADAGQRLGTSEFEDVARDGFYWPAVQFVAGRGILIGNTDGTFDTSSAMTRGQAAVLFARMFELDTSNPPANPRFGDVPQSHFAYAEIEAVAAAGISAGCGDGSNFCPSDDVTRGQMATFLARGLDYDDSTAGAPVFDDVPSSHTHFAAIQWLAARDIVSGCEANPPRYCPTEPLTRGQAAWLARRTVLWQVDNP